MQQQISVTQNNKTNFVEFMNSMNIPNIGEEQVKRLNKYLKTNSESLFAEYYPSNDGSYDIIGLLASMVWEEFDFTQINGFDITASESLTKWMDVNICDKTLEYLEKGDPAREVLDLLETLCFHD